LAGSRRRSTRWPPARQHFADELKASDQLHHFQGRHHGLLGYPTGGEVCGLRGGGCYQDFQGGAIIWSPASGAQPSHGAIRARWGQLGWENGFLGYPVAAPAILPNGDVSQPFQGGGLYWSARTGQVRGY
jgi:uncharacterized protein with LGFP repeats